MANILITGANGQVGKVLTAKLQAIYGKNSVWATDLRDNPNFDGKFGILDATEESAISAMIQKHQITEIYHLAAILSAKGEANPLGTWDVNMKSLFAVFEAARKNKIQKVFFPSSIAVFGPNVNRALTPQNANLDPTTVYGISKVAGENWANYYFQRYGLDIRSLRYPGIIGYQSLPGGGTTDYAVEIYHKAILGETYDCFIAANTKLPMIFMDDAIRATIEIMQAPQENIKTRTAYNLASMSFTPSEIAGVIQKEIPAFSMKYTPDFRQDIAASWPEVIDDSPARQDWNWKPAYDLEKMTKEMLFQIEKQYNKALEVE
ncbi:MAG: NAD-dependent epimerase/dehydratase family protein [Flavobacteriaceae bacterium]|nr:NAD-dependent epimerase/dehydratase family protein [Flavobacteriaceae bacterium]